MYVCMYVCMYVSFHQNKKKMYKFIKKKLSNLQACDTKLIHLL